MNREAIAGFRRNDELVPFSAQSFADYFFAFSLAIAIRGVDEVDAAIRRDPKQTQRVGGGDTGGERRELSGAQAEHRALKVCGADAPEFHRVQLSCGDAARDQPRMQHEQIGARKSTKFRSHPNLVERRAEFVLLVHDFKPRRANQTPVLRDAQSIFGNQWAVETLPHCLGIFQVIEW